jgi:hypothetical protein
MTRHCRPECPNQHQKAGQDRDESPLQPAWRADADQLPHEQSEIEAAGVNQQSLQDIRVTTEMHAPHAARLIEMSKRPFESLAAEPQ